MKPKSASFDTVRQMGLALPDVVEGTVYGSPALKVRDKMFVCIAVHRSTEPNTLAARISFRDRDEMIAADPETYYLTEHCVNYPVVLARLSRIHADALRDLVHMAHRFVSARSAGRRGSTAKRARARRAAPRRR